VAQNQPALRTDAARNRRALTEAARDVFGERGLDAPFDDIARRACIGNATLYRHFPTRSSLIAAVFADSMQDIIDAGRTNLENPDTWAGFADHVLFLCSLQASSRALADLFTTAITGAPELEKLRRRAHDIFIRLANQAKEHGQLRADFQPEDLALILMANAGLIHRTANTAPDGWKRVVHYVLDGLREESATTPAPPSPGLAAVRAAMAERASLLRCN